MSDTKRLSIILQNHGGPAAYIGMLALLGTFFIVFYANNFIYLDQWRMVVPLLGKYFAGELSVADLLYVESAHIRWGYNLVFVANGALFSLNAKVELFAGLIFLTTLSVLVYLRARASLIRRQPAVLVTIALIPILLSVWSLNKSSHFGWSLLGFNAFLSWLMYFSFWMLIEDELKSRPLWLRWVGLVALSLLMLFGFSGGVSLATFCTGVAIALVAGISNKDIRQHAFVLASFLIVLCSVESYIYFGLLPDQASPPMLNGLYRVLQNPLDAIDYVLKLFANGVVHAQLLRPRHMSEGLVVAIGSAVALAYLAALFLYFRRRMYQQTLLPLALILYALAFTAELLLTRFGTPYGFPTRMGFAGEPQFGMVGMAWILAKAVLDSGEASRSHTVLKKALLLGALALPLIVAEYYNASQAIGSAKASTSRFQQLVKQLRKGSGTIPPSVCRAGPECEEALMILREHDLTIFSEAPERKKRDRLKRE